jgi:hypothetical protein
MKVELLSVPGCPNVGRVRELLRTCLNRHGINVEVVEQVGDFPSPTVLVDGIDVTGAPVGTGARCRLDLPTEEQLLAALDSAH